MGLLSRSPLFRVTDRVTVGGRASRALGAGTLGGWGHTPLPEVIFLRTKMSGWTLQRGRGRPAARPAGPSSVALIRSVIQGRMSSARH